MGTKEVYQGVPVIYKTENTKPLNAAESDYEEDVGFDEFDEEPKSEIAEHEQLKYVSGLVIVAQIESS